MLTIQLKVMVKCTLMVTRNSNDTSVELRLFEVELFKQSHSRFEFSQLSFNSSCVSFISRKQHVYLTFQPSRGIVNEKFYTHPPLLPGEQIITQQDHVTCVDTFDDIAEGILHITTYRVIFAGCHVKVCHPICITEVQVHQ